MKKVVYHFHEGHAGMKDLLGGKGANLAEMVALGLPVPPGFTISTEACRAFYAEHQKLPEGLWEEIRTALNVIEENKREQFGSSESPLLVSVRSGARVSMPGMMDTVLNLGLNDATVTGLAARTGDARFAYDCYRRFIQMFGNVVLGLSSGDFERLLEQQKKIDGVGSDQEMTVDGLIQLIGRYMTWIERETGKPFPQDVYEQLRLCVEAVFRSWDNPRAKVYRKAYAIADHEGTAVTIQSMVFGNMGETSGTGVLFTRDPSTGNKTWYGEYLPNAQGEDVVAGTRTPKPVSHMQEEFPEVYGQLIGTAARLERHFKDMQDVEFTVEQGRLYVLQARSGKRTARAAVKIAVDLAEEGILTYGDAILRIAPEHLDQLLHRSFVASTDKQVIATGLPASPGAASGVVAMDADRAEAWAREGKKVVLVSVETSPEDIHGVIAAQGVLTSKGGMTSHAAVVARGMGKPCVCGCESIMIDEENRSFQVGGQIIREGDELSIDGSSGQVFLGSLPLSEPELTPELAKLLGEADRIRRLKVYANADSPEDAAKAHTFGAEGIGLCRTEHMFMSPSRLPAMQNMILAADTLSRRRVLDMIMPMQQADFQGIFEEMPGKPVTIRLLDPPLHEFLPDLDELLAEEREWQDDGEDARDRKQQLDQLIRKVREMQESNPMLGLRGCRLGLLFPEIYDMQIEAVFKAAKACIVKGLQIRPDIMIPLVGHPNELKKIRAMVDQTAEQVLGDELRHCMYRVGTMIEVPRAALVADQIARHADFFSFGTNDLTQMTYGYSRDDAENKFLQHYLDEQILQDSPFQTLDQEGVGMLIDWALTKGKQSNRTLTTGICGEHGGDRASILFCDRIGLDYVSCSAFRVPYARIAAAQATLLRQAETA